MLRHTHTLPIERVFDIMIERKYNCIFCLGALRHGGTIFCPTHFADYVEWSGNREKGNNSNNEVLIYCQDHLDVCALCHEKYTVINDYLCKICQPS